MKWLYAFLSRLLMVALLVASILGMLVTFPLKSPWFDPVRQLGQWLVERMLPQPHMLFWFWFGLFWAVVALGALASTLRRRTEGVTVSAEEGKVIILEAALRKYLRAALKQVAELELRNIEIYQQRHKLYVDLYVLAVSGARVPEVEAKVISLVKQALREQLGVEQEATVQIFVTDFINAANREDLVYRRSWEEENEEQGRSVTRVGEPHVADLEPESVAFGWNEEEPELKKPATDVGDEGEASPGRQPKKKRGGFWSLFQSKKSDESVAEPSAESAWQAGAQETEASEASRSGHVPPEKSLNEEDQKTV
ncbi:MAG: alkaline shock response membrane anchor protein AmaP [Candidatus Sumerlaeaceae bacterium]|nr:alkaline shock response membrane anchor protein AmaP [Candidatus Sumerlaeaceae bacterium]